MTFPRSPLGLTDASQDVLPKPCCTRMLVNVDGELVTTWCWLADGHGGAHEAPAGRRVESNDFGPKQASQRGWGR